MELLNLPGKMKKIRRKDHRRGITGSIYLNNLHTFLLSFVIGLILSSLVSSLQSENLWVDHNPYSSAASIRPGSILKVLIDEDLEIEYDYERVADERAKIVIVPDSGLLDFLPSVNDESSIGGHNRTKIRSRGRITFRMAVTVEEPAENGIVSFSGNRYLGHEEGRARHALVISGRVHTGDIDRNRNIHSENIADLQIIIEGAPIPQMENFPMQQVPGENDEEPTISAELTEAERQQILLEYINRIVGERQSPQ